MQRKIKVSKGEINIKDILGKTLSVILIKHTSKNLFLLILGRICTLKCSWEWVLFGLWKSFLDSYIQIVLIDPLGNEHNCITFQNIYLCLKNYPTFFCFGKIIILQDFL